jgi:thiamine-phosphate pyrophosphorylase
VATSTTQPSGKGTARFTLMLDLSGRRLYLCTGIRDDLASFLRAAVAGGVDVIQLREKHADDGAVVKAATVCAALCRDLGVPFILNDRPDLALQSAASGVHVGQDDVSVSRCREILGADAVVGLSTHEWRDVTSAPAAALSYLSAGPVNATPTKPGRAATGVQFPARAQAASHLPVFVTGGVTSLTVGPMVAAGLRHFVVVRAITESPDPRRAAAALRTAIDTAIAAAS